MNIYETANPFTECKVRGTVSNPVGYHVELHDRGTVVYPVSRSMLMQFASCPAKWIAGWAPKDTDATDWGSLIDCMVLTPDQLGNRFAIQPKTYPATKTSTAVKEGKAKEGDPIPWNGTATFCKTWAAQQDGKQIVSDKEITAAKEAHEKLVRDDRIFDILRGSEKQVLVEGVYRDKDTGLTIPAKCLIDIVPGDGAYKNSLADLKTTRSAHPRTWLNSVHTFGYDAQAAMCLWMYCAATGEDRNTFYHVIQENVHPYQIARRFLSHEFVEIGRVKIVNALRKYCKCLKTDIWPNWDDNSGFNGWSLVEPAPWMMAIEDTPEPVEEIEAPEYQLTDGLN